MKSVADELGAKSRPSAERRPSHQTAGHLDAEFDKRTASPLPSMHPGHERAPGVFAVLLVLAASMAAFALSSPADAHPRSVDARPAANSGEPSVLHPAVDQRKASLLFPTGVITEGQPFRVDVEVTGVDCTAAGPANESLGYFDIRFGDGFTWNWGEGVLSQWCDLTNLTFYFTTAYSYHSTGHFDVIGQAYWLDGTNRNAGASVQVGPPSMTTIEFARIWFGAVGATIGALGLATFVLRQIARPPPELPWGKV